jgi:hypothetical protein
MKVLTRALCLLAMGAVAIPVFADEIQLKDGKKFYGTIVAYDNKMFKVKTDFGFVLVEKDKIAAIIPNASESSQSEAKSGIAGSNKQPAVDRTSTESQPIKNTAPTPESEPAVATTVERAAPRVSSAAVRPQLPANAPKTNAVAPSIKAVPSGTASVIASSSPAAPLAPPKEAEIPQIPEEVQGNTYTNHLYGFRMYKAPSWQLIDDANELPNAIVAMGTQNESTLLVVGREKTKQPLEAAANVVEKRLQDVYNDYHQTSQKKTVVGGLPAVEYRYRGKADDHDWSGTLVVVARGNDIFTALGMTFADTDLIQIQENVIAKAIASLDFNVR